METPIFFRMGYNDQVKINLLMYSKINYEANRWYKIDLLMDWENENAAMFLDGKFVANTLFFS